LRGLRRADIVACDSRATREDAQRLIASTTNKPRITMIEVGLNYPYKRLPNDVVDARLQGIADLKPAGRFIMHVGSNLRRKNREGALRIFAKCAVALDAQMVFVVRG